MTIDEAKRSLERMQWQMDEDTFLVLDVPAQSWIARVSTTHLSARGREEERFYVLVSRGQHVILEEYTLPVLAAYINRREQETLDVVSSRPYSEQELLDSLENGTVYEVHLRLLDRWIPVIVTSYNGPRACIEVQPIGKSREEVQYLKKLLESTPYAYRDGLLLYQPQWNLLRKKESNQ